MLSSHAERESEELQVALCVCKCASARERDNDDGAGAFRNHLDFILRSARLGTLTSFAPRWLPDDSLQD